MKTIRIFLMSLAVVIAVGSAVAFKPVSKSASTINVDLVRVSDGQCSPNQNITLPPNCDPMNPGVVCQISFSSSLHNIKVETGSCEGDEYKKP